MPPFLPRVRMSAFAFLRQLVQVPRLALLALVVSALLPPQALPETPLCPSAAVLSLPCPGCGLTHAFCALSHGDLRAAAGYNPSVFLLYPLFTALALCPLLERIRPGITGRLARHRSVPILILTGMILMFTVWLARCTLGLL